MALKGALAEAISDLAKKKVAEKISKAKPSKRDDYKAVARDLLAAVKSGSEDELADALQAFRDVSGGDDTE